MRVLSRLAGRRADGPVALTIGNFDGVHRGHQAMLSRLIEAAEDLALPSAVLTFDPHPREFFARESAPPRLVVAARQARALPRCGRRTTYTSRASTRGSPRCARGVHRRRAGAPARRALGARRRGFPLRQGPRAATSARCARAARRSASRRCAPSRSMASARRRRAVRRALAEGDLEHAAALLGRPYAIAAASRTATSSGATWAFRPPTSACKRKPPRLRRLRRAGARPRCVAAHRASRASACVRRSRPPASRCSKCSSSISTQPIYGRRVTVEFVHKLRDEERYPDLDALDAPDPRRRGAGARLFRARAARRARHCS